MDKLYISPLDFAGNSVLRDRRYKDVGAIRVFMHPEVLARLRNEDSKLLDELESKYKHQLSFRIDPLMHCEEFKPRELADLIALSKLHGGDMIALIDRTVRGFVVDFIDVTCIDFYVFNIADSFVCVGCGLMILYLLLDEVRLRREKKEEAAASESDENDKPDET